MKQAIIISILFNCILNHVCAQQHALAKQWDKRFGGTLQEGMAVVIETKHNDYILLGSTFSGIGGDKSQSNWDATNMTEDFWVIKSDSVGNKIWDKRFGGLSEDFPSLMSLSEIKDGSYIYGGVSASDIGGDKTQPCWGGFDYWMIKTDSAGNKLWDKRFGGTDDDLLGSMQQTNDGGYIFGGASYSDISGDKTQNDNGTVDYWIVKTDSLGNKQWDADFGGTAYQFLLRISQTTDGGYILGGISSSGISGNKTQAVFGGYDYWIVKTDSGGNKQWDADYGGSANEELEGLIQTHDGGYILGGYSQSGINGDKTNGNQGGYDYWIVKTDSIGNKLWDKDYGGSGDDNLFSLALTNDGGYLLAGNSQSPAGGDKTENNIALVQTWIIKTDSAGNKQWDKTIFLNGNTDVANAFQTMDGCYVIGSFTGAEVGFYKTQPAWDSSADYWIVKFCDTIISSVSEITNDVNITIYPNPFATDIAIALQKQNMQQADFAITNTLGQTIYTQHETNLSPAYTKMLDLSYLPNGIYLLQVVVDGEKITKQIVKQ